MEHMSFTYTITDEDGSNLRQFTFNIDQDCLTWTQALDAFNEFLSGAGYIVPNFADQLELDLD